MAGTRSTPVQLTCPGCMGTFVTDRRAQTVRCTGCGRPRWVPAAIESEEWTTTPGGRVKAARTEVTITCPCGASFTSRAKGGAPNATCSDCGARRRVPHRPPAAPIGGLAPAGEDAGAELVTVPDPLAGLPRVAPALERAPRVLFALRACSRFRCHGDLMHVSPDEEGTPLVGCLECRNVATLADAVQRANGRRGWIDPYPVPEEQPAPRRRRQDPPADVYDDAEVLDVEYDDKDQDQAASSSSTSSTLTVLRAAMVAVTPRLPGSDYDLWRRRAFPVPCPNPWEQPVRLAGMPEVSPRDNPPCEWCEEYNFPKGFAHSGEVFVTNKHYRARGAISLVCLGHAHLAKDSPLAGPDRSSPITVTPFPSARAALPAGR